MTLTVLILLIIWLYASGNHRLVPKDLCERTITGFTKFLVFILVITIIGIFGSIIIPGFKNVSWIVSLVLFIYLTTHGYKRFISEQGVFKEDYEEEKFENDEQAQEENEEEKEKVAN